VCVIVNLRIYVLSTAPQTPTAQGWLKNGFWQHPGTQSQEDSNSKAYVSYVPMC
jgi:hypothetical protein